MKRIAQIIGVMATGLVAGVAVLAAQVTVRPAARAQTDPVPHKGDAADDPAVWVHPRDPGSSLIIGTDKQGALHTYNVDGSAVQTVADANQPNNVDVLYGFPLGGRKVDLAVAGVQGSAGKHSKHKKKNKTRSGPVGGSGLKVWAIDPATRQLSDVTAGGRIPVLDERAPAHGVCTYHSARTGRFYAFVTDQSGRLDQVQLSSSGDGGIGGTTVRTLTLNSIAEGCAADDELGYLYVAQETVGIWKFAAEPESGTEGRLITRIGENGLTPDVEGLAIYYAAHGRGYLIASSQGNDTYKVYERAGDNRYVLTIDPAAGRIDDVSHTDGIAVTNCRTSGEFASGLFVVQDGKNPGANQNFKVYGWEDIAGKSLVIDTACRARSEGDHALTR